MEVKLSARDEQGFEGATLKGDCDMYSAPLFARTILARLTEGARKIRIDLSAVDYLDSTGVGAIIRILQDAKRRGCEVRFRGIQGTPRKVLKMSNILTLMREEEARP